MGFSMYCISRLFYRSAPRLVDNDRHNHRAILGFASRNNYSDAGIFILRVVRTFFLIWTVGQVANNKLCTLSCRRNVGHASAVFILFDWAAVF